MPKKNTTKESLAAKRERLEKEEATRRQGEQEADELQRQTEESVEAAVRPTLGLWISAIVVTMVLIAVASMLWYALPSVVVEAGADLSGLWFLLALFGVGVILSLAGLVFPLGSVIAVRRWQSTEALIVFSEPEVAGYTLQSGPVTQPVVTYEYEVGGNLYSRSFALLRSSNTGFAERFCDKHPPGSTTKIRFDPLRPQHSLAPEFDRGTRLPILNIIMHLVLVAVVGLGIAFLISAETDKTPIVAETDQAPEEIKAVSKHSGNRQSMILWPEFHADLNKDSFDGYFLSGKRVTSSEVNAAHARLLNLDDKPFDIYLYAIARRSVPGDPSRAYIDNYLEALSQHSPHKLPELAKRMATLSGKSGLTGSMLLRRTNGTSYRHLISAVEALPAEAADGGTRAAAVAYLGGPEALGGRIAFDYFVAVVHGDEKAASAAVAGAATLDDLIPGSMPAYVGRLAAIDVDRTIALIRTFEGASDKDLLRTDRHGHAPEFEKMLVHELGLTAAEAYQVSLAVNVRYRRL